MKINIQKINEYLPEEIDIFVCSSNHSERWYQVLSKTKCKNAKRVIILNKSKDNENKITKFLNEKIDLYNNFSVSIIFDEQPIKQWNLIYKKITSHILSSNGYCIIDLTEIPKDVIYSLILQVHHLDLKSRVFFIYASASSYEVSSYTSNEDSINKLSSVLGYSENVKISNNKSHLILLVGFDVNLALALINDLEPFSISLGVGTDAFTDDFYIKNQAFRENILSHLKSTSSCEKISTFEFSCSDFLKAKNSILHEAQGHENVILCALNTKISAAAAAVSALDNDNIRLCHIEPAYKDKIENSQPSDILSIFKI